MKRYFRGVTESASQRIENATNYTKPLALAHARAKINPFV
jgi:hypothetical protein